MYSWYYRYVHLPSFDVASDAFATFKELLTRHKVSSEAKYLTGLYM